MEEKILNTTLVNYKGEVRDSEEIAKARWHKRGCACKTWHPEAIENPPEGCEGRPGCWCGLWHEKGESGNKRGRMAVLKPFATALEAALATCIPDENGIPITRMQKIVLNLIRIASDDDPKRADSAVRAILLLADRVDGKAAPSVEALEATGIKVVTINNVALTPNRPPPVKVLEPTFVKTNELEES